MNFVRKTMLTAFLIIGILSVGNAQINHQKQATNLIRELQAKLGLSDKQKDSLYSMFYLRSKLVDSMQNHIDGNPLIKQQIMLKVMLLNSRVDSLFSPVQRSLFNQWIADKKSKKESIKN